MQLLLIVLAITLVMKLVYWIVPLSVVRGIQLAQGLNFAMVAVKYVQDESRTWARASRSAAARRTGLDGLVLAIAAVCFILLVNGAGDEQGGLEDQDRREQEGGRREKIRKLLRLIPSAVIVFVLGVAFAVARHPAAALELRPGPSRIREVRISREAWKQEFLKGAVPHIPLSVLNSVASDDFEQIPSASPLSISDPIFLPYLIPI